MVETSLLTLSWLGIWITVTIVAGEVQYVVRPSQPQSRDNQHSCSTGYGITLSQFIKKSWICDNHCDDIILIFLDRNYSLESELVVENVHSFSMFAWPGSSSKVVITCDHNARFVFRNVSLVTISGLEFVGCFQNHVVAVDHFQLENSGFFGNGQALVNGTVLSIEESTANLNRVVFLSILNSTSDAPPDLNNCTACAPDPVISTMDRVTGILFKRTTISITQCWFEGNNVGLTGAVIYDEFGSDAIIFNTTFVNNSATKYSTYDCYSNSIGGIVRISKSYMSISKIFYSKFLQNSGGIAIILTFGGKMQVLTSKFINNTGLRVLYAENTSMSISHSDFEGNKNFATVEVIHGTVITIDHTKLFNNHGSHCILVISNTTMITVTHSEFLDNIAGLDFTDGSLIYLDGDVINVQLSEFINDRASFALVDIPYYATSESITDNVFHNNSAAYEVYIRPFCRPGLSLKLSLGSSRCIPCSENWHRDLIGIVVAAFIAGIALVIFLLALNMTVAVGTLNGILFHANIVAANANTYLLRFRTFNFATVLISWLNLDVGFDVCFIDTEYNAAVYKALLQLAFPAYVIVLVIIVIVASECSSKFAKIIGKGNPVAVLATMILLSYAKFFNAILAASSSLYLLPAYGSRNINVTSISLQSVVAAVRETQNTEFIAISYTLIAVTILLLFLCVMYTILVFSWQWLLRYQDKIIFKWVRYQKLRHFLEPYHAPYTIKYRYWTGLLLFARVFLYLISFLNFSLDPRVDLLAIILIVGGLIVLKGVTTKRVYKSWILDVIETFIYFNLVTFSALTWYILDFGGNQVALAYTSVMIIFILLLAVIVFHVFRYTRLYKCSFVEKAFKWTSSKLLEKTSQEKPSDDAPDELDGYRLVRSAAGDQNLPTVITYSVVGISQSQDNMHTNKTE
jgi:hypothetical protein